MMKKTDQVLSIFLDQEAHQYAQQFAAEQATPQKGKQVYLNTLAVYAVHRYLKWLSINTKLEQGDCWHSGLRAIFNFSDLVLPNIGKLKCCPVLEGEETFTIPLEARINRIGYVVVQFDESLQKGKLLGFISANKISEQLDLISLSQLQSLDSLIDTIEWGKKRVLLGQWLEGIFQEQWQPLPQVLAANPVAFRSSLNQSFADGILSSNSISRGKVITDGTGQAILLIVQVVKKDLEDVDLRLLFFPLEDTSYLPSGLQVVVLNESESPCLEAQARDNDRWLELALSGQHQDQFSVKITLGETTITEQFII